MSNNSGNQRFRIFQQVKKMTPSDVERDPKHYQGDDYVESKESLLRKVKYYLIKYLH